MNPIRINNLLSLTASLLIAASMSINSSQAQLLVNYSSEDYSHIKLGDQIGSDFDKLFLTGTSASVSLVPGVPVTVKIDDMVFVVGLNSSASVPYTVNFPAEDRLMTLNGVSQSISQPYDIAIAAADTLTIHDGATVEFSIPGAGVVQVTPRGVTIGPQSAGAHSFQLQAEMMLEFSWSEILPPIKADGSSVFKAGNTVPVKFQLTEASAAITDAIALLSYSRVINGVPGAPVDAVSTSGATTGSLFRYDWISHQYIFNWNTKGLPAGLYQLQIDLGDGVSRLAELTLK
jgi:hypothetical protein